MIFDFPRIIHKHPLPGEKTYLRSWGGAFNEGGVPSFQVKWKDAIGRWGWSFFIRAWGWVAFNRTRNGEECITLRRAVCSD